MISIWTIILILRSWCANYKNLIDFHLYPPVCTRIIRLDGTGGTSPTPTPDGKQHLVWYPRSCTLWGLHDAVQLCDGLHIHQHLQGVYDHRATYFIALHVRVILHLYQQIDRSVKYSQFLTEHLLLSRV